MEQEHMDQEQFKEFMNTLNKDLTKIRESDFCQICDKIRKSFNEAEKVFNSSSLTDPDRKFVAGRLSMARELFNFMNALDYYDD